MILRRAASLGVAAAALCLAGQGGAAAAAYTPPDHLDQWWYDAIGLQQLQERTDGGEGVTIAVLDGYLDPSVPDLEGADVTIKPGCDDDETPRDMGQEADHGTAMVTALVGQGSGNADGGLGVLGAVPNATVNFYSMNRVHDDGKPDCSGYYAGPMILRAVEDGADIISIQVTGGLVGGMEDDIAEAIDQGVVVVSSAGSATSNFGVVAAPADVPGVVSVGAGDERFRPWSDNPENSPNTGNIITFTSPGVGTPIGGFIDGRWVSGATRSGTSGAAAIAAGSFAIVKAAYPDATGNQLVQSAVRTARDDGTIRWTGGYGYGGVRAALMVEQDPSGWPDENPLRLTPQEVRSSLSPDDYRDPAAGSGDASGGQDQGEDPEAAPARQDSAPASTDDSGSPPVGALAVGGAIGLAVLGGAVLLARRRSHTS